ncbi:MAG: Cyclic pyranopterin monophosphate synthase [Bacteroidetes bacterium ADurb.Bin408]|nr:MAG: Cyclic pyranopterin monophosphate synthase [Bacteroidetes bacterium ADurb.Bin408]
MQKGYKRFGAALLRIYNTLCAPFYRLPAQSGYNALPGEIIENFNKSRLLGPQKKLCYAPFKMLYFAFNGEVVACCHNRRHILGKIPDQRIDEIWQGDALKKLRDHIAHNDLSLGCHICKDALMAGNYDGAKNSYYDRYSVHAMPRIMEFELDNRCNLSCIFCNDLFSSGHEKGLNEQNKNPYNDNFVKQLEPYIPYLKEAKFYGGEPFLINIYYDIWALMIKLNPKIEILIQTNGTILNDRIKELLDKGRFNINISIDSIKKEPFEDIRKGASFEKVLENVNYFQKYSVLHRRHLGIIPTPCRHNWKELPDITNWAGTLGAKVYFNTLVTPLEMALWNLPPETLEDIHTTLSQAKINQNTTIEKYNARHFSDFLKQLNGWRLKNEGVAAKKVPVTINELAAMKNSFLENIENALGKETWDKHKSMVENLLAEVDSDRNKILFYAVAVNIPIVDVTKEITKNEPVHLKEIIMKRVFEASSQFYLK